MKQKLENIMGFTKNAVRTGIAAIAMGALSSCATQGRLVKVEASRASSNDALQCFCLYGESPAKLEKGIQYGGIDPHAWPGITDEEKCWSYCQNR